MKPMNIRDGERSILYPYYIPLPAKLKGMVKPSEESSHRGSEGGGAAQRVAQDGGWGGDRRWATDMKMGVFSR